MLLLPIPDNREAIPFQCYPFWYHSTATVVYLLEYLALTLHTQILLFLRHTNQTFQCSLDSPALEQYASPLLKLQKHLQLPLSIVLMLNYYFVLLFWFMYAMGLLLFHNHRSKVGCNLPYPRTSTSGWLFGILGPLLWPQPGKDQ